MRTLLFLALAGLAACGGEPHMIAMPLGELVVPKPPTTTAHVQALLLPASESLIWDVRAAGLTIGRAELEVGEGDVHSKFSTSSLASMFTSLHHELVTTLDRDGAGPAGAIETVVQGTITTHSDVAFDGNGYTVDQGEHIGLPAGDRAHTMHTALGWIRAWAAADATPSYLFVFEDRRLFKLELARPTVEDLRGASTLRIDGEIHDDDTTIAVTMWLSADAAHRPLRVTIVAGKLHITAELIS